MALDPASLLASGSTLPNFSSSSSAAAAARSGDVNSSFMSGDFNVGGSSKDLIWIVAIIGLAVVAVFFFKGNKA